MAGPLSEKLKAVLTGSTDAPDIARVTAQLCDLYDAGDKRDLNIDKRTCGQLWRKIVQARRCLALPALHRLSACTGNPQGRKWHRRA
jgi:hypothetical protein